MILVYGATGYTGTLIVEECARRKIACTVAGRNEPAVKALAARLSLPYAVASLDDAAGLDRILGADGVKCVIHCAGPFSQTSQPMVDACLRTKRHYLDITGEIGVFEACAQRNDEAFTRGVMLMPGVGFDVVPTDCLALHVKQRLPSATKLRICIATFRSGLSHGTASTVVEHMTSGGAVRKAGVVVPEAASKRRRVFDVGDGKTRLAVSMPAGDVVTAWHSTAIPDIEVYLALPKASQRAARLLPLASPLLRVKRVKRFVQSFIPAGGPSEAARERARSVLVAEAEDDAGAKVTSRLSCREGYTTTVDTAILCALRVVDGKLTPGFQTPAQAYGADLVLEAPGTQRFDS